MNDTTTTTDETVEPTEQPEAPQEAAQEAQDAPESDEGGDEQPAAHEARKYRLQLRETEEERDQLAQRVEALQRAEAERIAGETVTRPAGIWAAGVGVADLLDDDGNIDTEKVKDATKLAAENLGLARHPRMTVPSEGNNPRPAPRHEMEDVISGGF